MTHSAQDTSPETRSGLWADRCIAAVTSTAPKARINVETRLTLHDGVVEGGPIPPE